MPSVICPGCGRRIDLSNQELSHTIECARCDTRFTPQATSARFTDADDCIGRSFDHFPDWQTSVARHGLVCAAIGAATLSCFGLISSQYFPVFGGLLEKSLAKPWSPARADLIPVHLITFFFAGVIVGGGFGVALNAIRRSLGGRMDSQTKLLLVLCVVVIGLVLVCSGFLWISSGPRPSLRYR